MKILFRPLAVWPHKPTPAYQRKRWPNPKNLTVSRALDMVDTELRMLGARRDAYIEVDIDEKHIRLDGELRSNAIPKTPACIIYAEHPTMGTLRWACDQYTRLEFNIRAIAGTLEALRAVARYGCVRDNEQFRGFKAIASTSTPTLALGAALDILAKYSPRLDLSSATRANFKRAVQHAQAAAHPDKHGGDRVRWDEVERAVVVLAPIQWGDVL